MNIQIIPQAKNLIVSVVSGIALLMLAGFTAGTACAQATPSGTAAAPAKAKPDANRAEHGSSAGRYPEPDATQFRDRCARQKLQAFGRGHLDQLR